MPLQPSEPFPQPSAAHAPRARLRFDPPDRWTVLDEAAGPGTVRAIAPSGPAGDFRSTLTVATSVLPAGPDAPPDLDALHADTLDGLDRVLTDALLIDDEAARVADRAARLATIACRQGAFALTLRLWTLRAAGTLITISGCCEAGRFVVDGPRFDELVAGAQLDYGPRAGS